MTSSEGHEGEQHSVGADGGWRASREFRPDFVLLLSDGCTGIMVWVGLSKSKASCRAHCLRSSNQLSASRWIDLNRIGVGRASEREERESSHVIGENKSDVYYWQQDQQLGDKLNLLLDT